MIFLPTPANLRYSYGLAAQLIHGLPLDGLDGRMDPPDDPATRRRLERVSKVALVAYNEAIGRSDPRHLELFLGLLEPELRGFAHEGVGLGLGILEICTPWGGGRIQRFLDHTGARPDLVYIGWGQALAALHRPLSPALERCVPTHAGFLTDGFGFFTAFFRRKATLDGHAVPGAVDDSLRPDFDVGVGRSLWFSEGTRAEAISRAIASFPEERRPWLWAGVGFAAAYAGGVDEPRLEQLYRAGDREALGHGVRSAVLTRHHWSNATERDRRACEVMCGVAPEKVVREHRGGCTPRAVRDARDGRPVREEPPASPPS